MKRTYLKGCEWCGATGFVPTKQPTTSTSIEETCPVCNGNKTVTVTEEN